MPEQRPHNVHLGVAHTGISGRMVDRLQDEARLEEPQTRPTVLFWNERAKPATFRERVDELRRVVELPVELMPIFAGKVTGRRPAPIGGFVPAPE